MSVPTDTRANVERPDGQRPVHAPPPVPDLESSAPYWHGPASTRAASDWKARALCAEREVDRLRRILWRWGIRP
jgi:hypothetical protein